MENAARWNPYARAIVGIGLVVWAFVIHEDTPSGAPAPDNSSPTALIAAGVTLLALLVVGVVERWPRRDGD